MEIERLKVIAGGMGYETAKTFDFIPKKDVVYIGDCSSTHLGSNCHQYDPENNPAQLLEIIEKTKIDLRPILDFWAATARNGDTCRGETLSEAVLQAAYEVFKNE